MSQKQWRQVRTSNGNKMPKLKLNKVILVLYMTAQSLLVTGRSKCNLIAQTGTKVESIVHVVKEPKKLL